MNLNSSTNSSTHYAMHILKPFHKIRFFVFRQNYFNLKLFMIVRGNSRKNTVRRATQQVSDESDIKAITGLINNNGGLAIIRQGFCPPGGSSTFNINAVVETTFLTLVIEGEYLNNSKSIVACVSLDDGISVTVDQEIFEKAIDSLVQYIPVNKNNCLFINFLLLEEKHSIATCEQYGHDLLHSSFDICDRTDYLVWLCPKNYVVSDFIEKYFVFVQQLVEHPIAEEGKTAPRPEKTFLDDYKVFYIHRSTILPRLLVREARVEDNDDLLPIVQNTYPHIIGDSIENNFLLADMIESQDEKNKIFVGCLRNNSVVGMLSTSCDVNISLLTRIFDVSLFPDIAIKQRERPPPPPLAVGIVGDIRQIELDSLEKQLSNFDCVLINAETEAAAIFTEAAINSGNALQYVINEKMQALSTEQTSSLPQAFVVLGYPRHEGESSEQADNILSFFDFILELHNGDDSEEDDEDEFIQQHLDAAEFLREQHLKRRLSPECKLDWRRISIGSNGGDKVLNLHQFSGELSRILELRYAEIQAQLERDNDEPLRANAFAVTLFAMDKEFESRSDDLLRLAFEEQPHLQYCLFMLPNTELHNPLVKSFSHVQTRAGLSFDQSLYILHRSYYLAKDFLEVSRFEVTALSALEHFLLPLPEAQRKEALSKVDVAMREGGASLKENPREVCMVVRIADTIIGCVQLSRKLTTDEDVVWLRAHFNADDYLNFEKYRARNIAAVTRWTLNPIYMKWSRFILREIMRLYYKRVLFFQADAALTPPKEILDEFIHLNPRRRMQHPTSAEYAAEVASYAFPRPSAKLGGPGAESPLFFISKKNLSLSKNTVTKRVVVVGGSSHSVALLETLCSISYLNLPNVYLIIDRPPLPLRHGADTAEKDGGGEEESKMDDEYSGCLSVRDVDHPLEKEFSAMGLIHKVNVVRGSLTDIDRENRAVVVSDDLAIEYDVLVLSTYTQDSTTRRIPAVANMHPSKCGDCGIFSLGNPTADLLALRWVRRRHSRPDPIVIYGDALKAFGCAAKLMRYGVPPTKIVVVVSEESPQFADIEDSTMTLHFEHFMGKSDLKIYWGHHLGDLTLSANGFLHSVHLERKSHITDAQVAETLRGHQVTVTCIALLLCHSAQLPDKDVFTAINESGLVFDGGLVVDQSFRTVDPAIYGVSDYTKFSRMYKEALPHARFNPRELGTYVALKVLEQHLDPTLAAAHYSPNPSRSSAVIGGAIPLSACSHALARGSGASSSVPAVAATATLPLPEFRLPRSFSADLPNNLTFFRSTLPQPSSDEVQAYPSSRGSPRRECVLKVSELGVVNEFIYIGEDAVEERNLSQLLGLHEALLNGAIYTYESKEVDDVHWDWISFFRGSWAAALYHDKFPSLLQAMRLTLKTDKGMLLMLQRVLEMAAQQPENLELSKHRRDFTGPRGEGLPESTVTAVAADVQDHLKLHKTVLRQYNVDVLAKSKN